MSEKNCHFVSSRGILHSCDVKSNFPVSSIRELSNYNIDWSNLIEGSKVYICSSAIPSFNSIIERIPCKFILVTGDCDECCATDLFQSESDFQLFIENPKIIHWFSQNLVTSHPKMTKIPIGLDYHTMTSSDMWGKSISSLEQESILIKMRNSALPFSERRPIIYSNFHFNIYTKYATDRRDAISQIPQNLIYYEPNKINRYDTWVNQTEFAFVASPHGNGLDCHRTWEALCLGCIVIVKTSPLDELYKDLPVLIVKEWENITESLLLDTIENFKNSKFLFEKLTLEYWMNKITNVLGNETKY
jgi:hypothetical protein